MIKQQFNFEGEITFETVMTQRKQAEDLLACAESVEFDFSKVSHCDSSALALLLVLKRAGLQNRVTIAFSKLPQSLLDLARLCNLSTIIESH